MQKYSLLTEILTKVSGRTTKLMDLEYMYIIQEPSMRGTGPKICRMESALKSGLTLVNTKAAILMVKNMVRVNTLGQMVVTIKGHGSTIESKDLENTSGTTEEAIVDTGKTTKCTDMEFINGRTRGNMMGIISMTKNKVLVNTTGLMGSALKVYGLMERGRALER